MVTENTEVTPEANEGSEEVAPELNEGSSDEPKEESFADFVKRMESQKADPKPKEEPKQEVKPEQKEEPKQEAKPKEEPKPSTIKYKVDGEEKEIDIKDVPNLLSKAAGADKRFQEAAQIRSEAKEFVNFIKTNPIEALKRAGIDFEELAINHVHEMIQVQNMSPEQREAYEIKKENERLKKEQAERDSLTEKQRKEQEEKEIQELTDKYVQEIESGVIAAMEANPHLPRSRVVADRFLHYYRMAIDQGYEGVTMQQLVPYVEKDFEFQIRQQRVDQYKSQPKQEVKKEAPKKGKRITSIYDLID